MARLRRRDFVGYGLALAASPARAQATAIAAVAEYEKSTGGRIGFYAENVLSGRKASWRADERFVMCSTFKASLAALVLSRADRRRDDLDDRIAYGPSDVPDWYAPVAKANLAKGFLTVGEMCAAAVEQSDNTAPACCSPESAGPRP